MKVGFTFEVNPTFILNPSPIICHRAGDLSF